MDQIFDTDAPGCVNNVSPLGPGMSWKSTTNSSGQDSIQKIGEHTSELRHALTSRMPSSA